MSKEKNKVFAENLRYFLERSGETQVDVAKAIGVLPSTFCDYCQGRTHPRMDKVERIANYFDIDITDLVEERSYENPNYVRRQARTISRELSLRPEAMEFFKKYQALSKEDAVLVESLIDRLLEREAKNE